MSDAEGSDDLAVLARSEEKRFEGCNG